MICSFYSIAVAIVSVCQYLLERVVGATATTAVVQCLDAEFVACRGVMIVILWSTLTALSTGVGALPFLFTRRTISSTALSIANAAAAGLMFAASVSLCIEGAVHCPRRVLLGVGIGVAFMLFTRHLLQDTSHLSLGELSGADARKALLIVGVMTLHSFAEGVGVGVSFGSGERFGAMIALATAVHNIPEGLAIALVLVPRGTSVAHACLWSIFSSLPQPLMALPAFWFVQTFETLLPLGLGAAAGAMFWMVFAELGPDAVEHLSVWRTLSVATAFALPIIYFSHLYGGWRLAVDSNDSCGSDCELPYGLHIEV